MTSSRLRLGLAALVVLGLMPACKSGDGPSAGPVDSSPDLRMQRAARSCGLLSDGELPAFNPDFYTACILQCIVEHATCEDLADLVCSGTTRFDSACDDVCTQDVECADGSTISLDDLCDGYDDCDFGEDEEGCGAFRFTCEDGSTIDKFEQCDGYDDCGFGEDEAGCPTFRCSNGTEISTQRVCDGDRDCSGGEDEVGCAMAICPG